MNVEVDNEWGKNGEDEPNLWTDWKDAPDAPYVPFPLFDDWNPQTADVDVMFGDLFDDWNPDDVQRADDLAMVGDQSQTMTCGERVGVDSAVLGSNNGSVDGLPREKQVLRRTVRKRTNLLG